MYFSINSITSLLCGHWYIAETLAYVDGKKVRQSVNKWLLRPPPLILPSYCFDSRSSVHKKLLYTIIIKNWLTFYSRYEFVQHVFFTFSSSVSARRWHRRSSSRHRRWWRWGSTTRLSVQVLNRWNLTSSSLRSNCFPLSPLPWSLSSTARRKGKNSSPSLGNETHLPRVLFRALEPVKICSDRLVF